MLVCRHYNQSAHLKKWKIDHCRMSICILMFVNLFPGLFKHISNIYFIVYQNEDIEESKRGHGM